ncbi:hypothetical protein [Ruminococcus sp.]|uniref:hypothetical protein n=1 Tax=Ruminococcus sp. TaxID=41978 RepID=UPI002E823B51|nr:hypothetical protein [Ruminococcus sp.]MEE3493344.1 hypothetical protein [Ruminococcus sp.]
MKAKRLLTLALAVLMIAMTVVSVSAVQLTETDPDGQTEVKAHIGGSTPEPGDVTYIITIPDVVDFGELKQEDTKKDVAYTVTLDEVNNLDPDAQQISVYVKNQNATVNGDQEFYITNKADSTKKFSYDVYSIAPNEMTDASVSINQNTMTQAAGYYLVGFTTAGETLSGSLRLDQNQLMGYNLADIVGDYNGYMVFFSIIEDQ